MAKIIEQYRLLGKGRGRLNHKDKSQSESIGIWLPNLFDQVLVSRNFNRYSQYT